MMLLFSKKQFHLISITWRRGAEFRFLDTETDFVTVLLLIKIF